MATLQSHSNNSRELAPTPLSAPKAGKRILGKDSASPEHLGEPLKKKEKSP
jgi:hypothetical protein